MKTIIALILASLSIVANAEIVTCYEWSYEDNRNLENYVPPTKRTMVFDIDKQSVVLGSVIFNHLPTRAIGIAENIRVYYSNETRSTLKYTEEDGNIWIEVGVVKPGDMLKMIRRNIFSSCIMD